MGFPSVHHISFCISRTKGISGVAPNIVQGVRAHSEIMRMYEMARHCCKVYQKGMIHVTHNDDAGNNGVGGLVVLTKNNQTSAETTLCSTSLEKWRDDIYNHLQTVIQSGIVGLFDTPYPYLADQLLELSNRHRSAPPIIAMTNREANEWAKSRSKHELLLCKTQYSYEQLGASEFDLFGCVERASSSPSQSSLHFWNVFQSEVHITDETLEAGMARQMEHFQEVYTPKSEYVPDMFGMKKYNDNDGSTTAKSSSLLTDKQIEVDISTYILGNAGRNVVTKKYQSIWKDWYKPKSISCRGRVKWNKQNDSLVEVSSWTRNLLSLYYPLLILISFCL